MIWNILVYAIVAVGVILLVALTVFRIDWARHPEKYKELEKSDEKSEYWAKKKLDQEAAQKRAKEKEKAEKAAKTPGQGQPLPRHRGSKAPESQPAEQKIEEIRKISGNAGDFPYFLNRFPVLL